MARKEERQNMTKSEVRDMVEPYKPLYTAKQAAQILLINVSTVYELMNTGQGAMRIYQTKVGLWRHSGN